MAWVVFPANIHADAGLDEAELRRLENGDIFVDAGPPGKRSDGMVAAAILIKASPEDIWRIMIDCPEIPAFVPGLKSCQVLDSGESWEIIRHETKWIWFLPKITYVLRADYERNRRIEFARIKGDLREMRGNWTLTPLNDGGPTILRYSVFLDPGFGSRNGWSGRLSRLIYRI